jgi:hypothetical protein
MIFSDFYKGPKSPLAKLRHSQHDLPPATPDWAGEEHADLLSRDKTKQKVAVKRYLAAKIKNDWVFNWPPEPVKSQPKPSQSEEAAKPEIEPPQAEKSPQEEQAQSAKPELDQDKTPNPANTTTEADAAASLTVEPAGPVQDETRDDDGYQVDDDADLSEDSLEGSARDNQDDAESIYSIVSEDPTHFQPRLDWASDLSDDETLKSPTSPYRFESPDAVGSSVFATMQKKRGQAQRLDRCPYGTGTSETALYRCRCISALSTPSVFPSFHVIIAARIYQHH